MQESNNRKKRDKPEGGYEVPVTFSKDDDGVNREHQGPRDKKHQKSKFRPNKEGEGEDEELREKENMRVRKAKQIKSKP